MSDFRTDLENLDLCTVYDESNTSPVLQQHARITSISKIDDAMRKHMAHIVLAEHRPFSYLDFLHFEVDGKRYRMTHGTFRNKILKLKKSGIVELDCNSVPAFYTLKGVSFGKKKSMTPMMTPNPMGDTPVTGVISSLYDTIQNLSPDQKAIHDIHMKFHVPDIWKIISLSGKYTINPNNKDISLPPVIAANNLKIRITVHHTDTVTVVAACSDTPIVTDLAGIIRLSNALTRTEERVSRILDQCGEGLEGGYESIPIPEHGKWTVTLWHIGTDTRNYREFASKEGCVTWQDTQKKVLCREYTKKNKDKKNNMNSQSSGTITTTRREIQEYPNKTLTEAIAEKFDGVTGGMS